MRNIHLYITSSIDGYIARKNGEVDWLFTEGDYGYADFASSIDTVVMGGATYRQVLTFGDWPYQDFESLIITRSTELKDTDKIRFISTDPVAEISKIKNLPGKDIWLIGGGDINRLFLDAGLIDRISWFIHPVVLGDGIPLFTAGDREVWFDVHETKSYDSGMVYVDYRKKSI